MSFFVKFRALVFLLIGFVQPELELAHQEEYEL